MRILISDDLSPEAKAILERIPAAQVDVRVGLKPQELREIIGGYEALAVRSATKVTKEVLDSAQKLRVIGRAGTGVDNIDLGAASRRGVVVMNAPGGNSVSVAEHTVALLLALARQIADASQSTRGGKWEKKKFASGRELMGKTLGVIGTGNIGALVVRRAQAFGMKVLGYDPLLSCPNFIGTPHLGGSTEDAQQNVATIVCEAMVDYLTTGTIRNAVNVPSVSGEVLERLGPFLRLCEKMGALSGQLALEGQTSTAPEQIEIAYAGEVAEEPTAPLTAAVLKGVLGTFLAEPVNEVSAPALAKERGLSVTQSRSNETPDFASLVTVRLRSKPGMTEVAGTIIGKREPRIVRVNEFEVEAAPQGTLLVMVNHDKPGVIGNVGRTLGEAQVNIAQFALARVAETGRALALVNIDGTATPDTLEKLRKLPHVLEVRQVVL